MIIVSYILSRVKARNKLLKQEKQIQDLELAKQLIVFTKSMEIEEKVRKSIYRNMHDQVNPRLRSLMRRLEMHKRELNRDALTRESLDTDIDLILSTISDIRSSTYDLVPSYLLEFGLIKSMEMFLQVLHSPGMLNTNFYNHTAYEETIPFNEEKQLTVFRIYLEILENIVKHACSTVINVSLTTQASAFIILVSHNGIGIDNETVDLLCLKGEGEGLKSTRARALMLKGFISYHKEAEMSTIKISIPI